MADKADIADEHWTQRLNQWLGQRPRYQGVSRTHCAECDAEIPEARRVALPGVDLCVDCQALREARP